MIQRFIMEVNIPQFIWFALITAFVSWRISWSIKDFVDWKREQREMQERDKIREKAKKIRKEYRYMNWSMTGPHYWDKHFIGVDWADPKKRPLTYMVCGVRYGKMEHFRWNSQRLNG